MAGTAGLEPVTSDVTGRRSNQLSYVPAVTSYSQRLPRRPRLRNHPVTTFLPETHASVFRFGLLFVLDSRLQPQNQFMILLPMLFTFLLGIFAGLRSLTAPAAVAWAAKLGWVQTWSWFGSTASVAIFTLLAIGELIVDKLSFTPSRLEPLGLFGRFCTGALCGAALAGTPGAITGAVGGVTGSYLGYNVRTRSVKALGVPDLPIALAEDAIAVAGSLFVVARFR